MTTNTLNSRYDDPDTVWEEYVEVIPARLVRRGDVLTSGGDPIADLTIGHKFVTARIADGRPLFRLPLDEEVRVYRKRETKESRDATRRYDKNRRLEVELETNLRAGFESSLAKLNEHADAGYMLTYQDFGAVISEQAEMRLWLRYASVVEQASDPESRDDWELKGADHVTIMEAFVSELRTSLSEGYSNLGIHRSSNVLSNLMEDEDRRAAVEFIRNQERYYW